MLGILLTCRGFRPLRAVGRVYLDCWGLRRDEDRTCTSVVCIQCGSCKGRHYFVIKSNCMEHITSEANNHWLIKSPVGIATARSLSCSQESATNTCPAPMEPNPYLPTFFFTKIIKL